MATARDALDLAREHLQMLRANAPVAPAPYHDYEINEINEKRSGSPCPRCGNPLDAFACCWRCELRLCQTCGTAFLRRPFARECQECLSRLFPAVEVHLW
jgi:hypothetical protein